MGCTGCARNGTPVDTPFNDVDLPTGVAALVDHQSPRQIGRSPVQLLVEVVPDPADRLGQNDSWRDRIAERRQRYALPPTADPGADATQRDRTPDAQAALLDLERRQEARATGAEVCVPIGEDVVEPTTDQPKDYRPQRNVEDDARLAAAFRPAPVADEQRDDHAYEDEQRVGANRD